MSVDLTQYAGKYPQPVLDAIGNIFSSKPDQERAFTQDYAGNLDAWLNAFQSFWTDPSNTGSVDLSQFGPESALMGALGYNVNPAHPAAGASLNTSGGGTPVEQGIFQLALPGLVNQVAGDADRQKTVADLTAKANEGYANLGGVLAQGIQHFDGQAYFQQNPNVGAIYNQSNNGGAPGTKSIQTTDGKVVDMTADQFAEYYHKNWGASQGLQPTFTSDVLKQQQGNAAAAADATIGASKEAAAAQLNALNQSFASMTQNLQGNLAAKAQALQTAVSSLNQNLDQYDAAQKANLATQIQTMQSDLETSINSQRQALSTEVQQLQGNSSDAANARRAALQQELDGLNAAQAPLNQARLQGAEALSTAVNLGLTATQKDILAKQAAGGFIGGSTMTDAALARASIGARQDAAGAIANANVANATDTAAIGQFGARQRYSIADALAGERQSAANLGATGGAQLSAALAQGKQAIGDTGATGLRTIGDTTAGTRANIGNSAASQTYADTVGGANSLKTLQDTLSSGGYNIATALANQTLAAKNNQAAANFNAGQNLYATSVNAAAARAALPGNQAQTLSSIVPYGNAGTNSALNTLSWWGSPATPPNPTSTITPPSTTGNGVSQFGTGLLGGAFTIGNANKWWQTTPTSGGAGSTSGDPGSGGFFG